ncbi:MAG: Flp pilus assembly complex ATPase component TadA, partial [Candidatus Omnitrophica bacterium]|nr:Flp pilus assembly complex ATPase component TadA [Candidatus Omnitrophota bacterium]
MNSIEKEVYDRILDKQLLGKEQLDDIVRESQVSKTPLLKEILVKNLLEERELLLILSAVLNIRYVDMNDIVVEKAALDKVHVRVAWHYEFMPLSFSGKTLSIAVNIPLSIRAEDEIRLSLGCEINMVLARKDQILDSLKKHYGLAADTVDKMMGYGRTDFGDQVFSYSGIEDIEKKAEEASVARLVNQIILEAYKKRATDIHIEPYRGKVSLRYRIDGKLHDQPVSEDFMRFLPPILSRVKIIANLNIVERRVPQDGKAIVKITDQVLDLRVS